MRNLSLNDPTQQAILPHLEGTERLLSQAVSKISGKDRGANVIGMSDLGFADNVSRMMGGFYTGSVYSWDSDVPFVPVDATVNSCGVSLFSLRHAIDSKDEFDGRIAQAMASTREKCSYVWNFGSGNHFVTYGTIDGKPHLMMHSSAAELKSQYNGLYPTKENWFDGDIKRIDDEETGRYLRYIDGFTAEIFISTAQSLESFNASRHQYFAGEIAGRSNVVGEVSNEQHYGMPTRNSVAIGCQWKRKEMQILLTAPRKPIYLIEPEKGGENDVEIDGEKLLLFPHGLGKKADAAPTIAYKQDALEINGGRYGANDSLRQSTLGFALRNFDEAEAADGNIPAVIADVLAICPGKIRATFEQVFSYNAGSK